MRVVFDVSNTRYQEAVEWFPLEAMASVFGLPLAVSRRSGRRDTTTILFIKVISKESGKNMMHGDFESMSAVYALLADFTPKPIAWGTYETVSDMHFFLCEFRN